MPGNGIEGSKELVLCYYFCFGQRVEEGRFAGVGITNNGNDGHSLGGPLLTMKQSLFTDALDIFTQVRDAAANTAAVYFQFCFTGAAYPNSSSYTRSTRTARTACLLGKPCSSTGQTRQTIF